MPNPQQPDDHHRHDHDHEQPPQAALQPAGGWQRDDLARQQEHQREVAAELTRERDTAQAQAVIYVQQPTPPQPIGATPMSFSFPSLGSILQTLQAAGLTPAAAASAVQTLAANSPTTAINTLCQTVLQNSNNPTVVKDCCVKLAEIPNLPIAVANLVPALAAATDAMQVTQVVQAIETAANPNGGGFGFHVGGF